MTEQPTATPQSAKKLFYGLFIFPLVIALGMAVILCTVVLLTHERETPETLLAGIVKVAPAKRWQKAFELSNELNRHPEIAKDPAVLRPMMRILEDSANYDAKTRGYMAIALTHAPSPETEAALIRSLKDAEEEYALYGLWALGQIRSKDATPTVLHYLESATPELRKVAAYVAGAIGDTSAIPALTPKLNDTSDDVRWNAALSLSRLGSEEGWGILSGMLDRGSLEKSLNADETRIEQVMTNAIKGLVLIPKPSSIKILESLSRNDKNMKVRQAAMQALSAMEKKNQ